MTEIDRTIQRLDALIRATIPEATTVSKYGGTLYTMYSQEKEGQFCGVFPYTGHVQLSFSKGALLDDPGDILSGTGKYRRHINYASSDHVEDTDLVSLIRAAAAL